MNNYKLCFVLKLILAILLVSLLLGCDEIYYPSNEAEYTGEYFKKQIEYRASSSYNLTFTRNNLQEISLIYTIDGTEKKAVFLLDGFDEEEQIGYKLVTKEEAAQWGELREKGNLDVPDLNDINIIRQYAMDYKYPVLFIWVPEYEKSIKGVSQLFSELDSLLTSDRIKEWLQTHRQCLNIKSIDTIVAQR